MGTCASQDHQAVLDHSSNPSAYSVVTASSNTRGTNKSSDYSNDTASRALAKTASNYSSKQSYDTASAETVVGKSSANENEGVPLTVSGDPFSTTPPSECAPSASENRPPSLVPTPNGAHWSSLVRFNYKKLVDPADVIFFLDERMCSIINRLSPAEVSFVQRRVRSVVQSLLKVQGDTSQPHVRSKTIYNDYRKLDEFAVRKIFSAGNARATNGSRWWYGQQQQEKANDSFTDLETNASSLESIWQRSWKEFDSRRERRLGNAESHNDTQHARHNPANESEPCPSDEENHDPPASKPMITRGSSTSTYSESSNHSRSIIQRNPTYTPDPIGAAYCILNHLSENRWTYLAHAAQLSSQRSGLILDVNQKTTMQSDDMMQLLNKALDDGKVLVPPLYPGQDESTDYYRTDSNPKSTVPTTVHLSPGITMKEVTFLVSMALRGSRTQKLFLLFYLLLPMEQLNQMLDSHPTLGVPTWLLEVDSNYIFSLESLSHYYYFGGRIPGDEEKHDNLSVPEFTNELMIDALSVIQLIAGLLYVQDSTLSEINYVGDSTSDSVTKNPVDSTYRDDSDGDRGRFLSYDYSKYQSAKIHAIMTNFLGKRLNNVNDADFDDVPGTERKLNYLDAFWTASEKFCTMSTADENAGARFKPIFWTLQDFLSWADESLANEGSLNLIMESLFGTGIIPTPGMERYLVSQSWIEWQKEYFSIMSKRQDLNPNSEEAASKSLFYWSRSSEDEDQGKEYESSSKYVAWGGIAGLDGGGQLGFGIMYCIDKKWWEQWMAYVQWPWSAHTGVATRPGDLSMENLLDHSDDSMMQSQGSFKCMRKDVQKDIDYVLIPTSVWDIFFELYGGGPPLPRFILPFLYQPILSSESPSSPDEHKYWDSSPLPLYPSIIVDINPWVLECHLCDPKQPYRRGVSGAHNIKLMAHPNQPIWRLFSEIMARLPIMHPRAKNDSGQGLARLWKRTGADVEPLKHHNLNERMDAWELMFNNRYVTFAFDEDRKNDFFLDWDAHSDGGTVSSVGLGDRSHLMLEYAIFGDKNTVLWPRHSAAKADKTKKLADEDEIFRLKLRGLDINGQLVDPKTLIGLTVDALDESGCWYHAIINRLILKGGKEIEEVKLGYPPILYEEVETVSIRFCNISNRSALINVDSDKLAIADRFSGTPTDDEDYEYDSSGNQGKVKNKRMGSTLLQSVIPTNQKVPCKLPYFGACALSNLGNTCYMNVSIQCLSYIPFLRSYLVSDQFIINDDVNRTNPLGTGGVIVDAFSDLLQKIWSGKYGVLAPKEFRTQLVKVRYQYSGLNQQDAQEFLSDLLDSLHEDCNKILSKPIVEPLNDHWVKRNSLQTVGDAAWRRFLRRNYSLITDIAMGQVLNIVTCPACGYTSRNFDPFSILSLPVPSKVDGEQLLDSDAVRTSIQVTIGSCLDEFCQEQRLDSSESWICPNCNDLREGIQRMTLWKIPDILIFHLKRFNCTGESREKITTLVDVPLTSLNMRKWFHEGSDVDSDPDDSYIYDLIGVINHLGSMTGGHYVALCKATGCGPDGSEEVSHCFSGASVYPFDSFKGYNANQSETIRKWFASNKEKESLQDKALAAMQSSKAVAESCEPTWLRFDDDLMESISPSEVVSEKAYVLFFRRRRISPCNMAKYSTIS